MRNFFVSLLIAVALIFLQTSIYTLFLKPPTSTWGASAQEASAPMPGDELSAEYQSTRAITINAPLGETWVWLNQLGADRSGFFSYTFIEQFLGYETIEQFLGYETRPQAIMRPDFPEFQPGDIIRGSIAPSKSVIIYEFPVLGVSHEAHLVVENWGTFLLIPISDNQTRLIIRTHRLETNSWMQNAFEYYFAEGLHFVMERATLRGFKARVEAGEGPKFDDTLDRLWFYGVVASAIAIAILIFLVRGMRQVIIPTALSTVWTLTLLIFDPIPLYSLALFALLCGLVLHQIIFCKTAQTTQIGV